MTIDTKKEIEEILEKLTEKRGKHSELWMWPKEESLNEATQAIMALAEKREKEVVKSIFEEINTSVWVGTLNENQLDRLREIKWKIEDKYLPIKEENSHGK